MPNVHLFVCTGRFRSFKAMRAFIDMTYTEDGDSIPSDFIGEVGLTGYEPMCIEAIHSPKVKPLRSLLKAVSYASQWLAEVPEDQTADSAICVFEPNKVRTPRKSSLSYVGSFQYRP